MSCRGSGRGGWTGRLDGSNAPGDTVRVTDSPAGSPRIDVLLDGFGINTNAGRASLCSTVLIEGADARGRTTRILVDPAHVGRRTFLRDALADRDLAPADIDMVVLTHAHWDHVQNADVFRHAPVYMHPEERRYCHRPHPDDWATPPWTSAIMDAMEIRETEEGDELIPGVGVVDLPGHTVGSIGITVENEQGVSLVTGDALANAGVALSRECPLVFWDREDASASIDRVVAIAELIYPGHGQPFRLTRDRQIEYTRPFSIVITGTSADREGLGFDDRQPEPWTMPGERDRAARERRTADRRKSRRAP